MSVVLRKPSEFESAPHEAGGVAYGRRHGRGAQTNRSGRFEPIRYEPADDGWDSLSDLEALQKLAHDDAQAGEEGAEAKDRAGDSDKARPPCIASAHAPRALRMRSNHARETHVRPSARQCALSDYCSISQEEEEGPGAEEEDDDDELDHEDNDYYQGEHCDDDDEYGADDDDGEGEAYY